MHAVEGLDIRAEGADEAPAPAAEGEEEEDESIALARRMMEEEERLMYHQMQQASVEYLLMQMQRGTDGLDEDTGACVLVTLGGFVDSRASSFASSSS